MRQRLKHGVDANQKEIVEALRREGRTVILMNGVFDLLVGFEGQTYILEVKMPKGKLRPSQLSMLDKWVGGPIRIVTTPEQAIDYTGGYYDDLD